MLHTFINQKEFIKKVHDLIQIFNAMLWIRNDLSRIRIREECSKKFKNVLESMLLMQSITNLITEV